MKFGGLWLRTSVFPAIWRSKFGVSVAAMRLLWAEHRALSFDKTLNP